MQMIKEMEIGYISLVISARKCVKKGDPNNRSIKATNWVIPVS